MVGTVELGLLVDPVRQIQAVFCQKRHDGIEALLQMLVREYQVHEVFGVGRCLFVPAQGFAGGFALQLLQLIKNFGRAFLGGGLQGGVEGVQICLERLQGFGHGELKTGELVS